MKKMTEIEKRVERLMKMMGLKGGIEDLQSMKDALEDGAYLAQMGITQTEAEEAHYYVMQLIDKIKEVKRRTK